MTQSTDTTAVKSAYITNPLQMIQPSANALGINIGTLFAVWGLLLSPLGRLTGAALFAVPRRMLGLFAAFYAFVHAWAWCRQYGYDWSFLLEELWRLYLALGLAAVLLLVPLTATSNAWARRHLGTAWARLHQLAYAIALLALLHFMLSRAVPPRESWLHLALVAVAVIHRVWPMRPRA